MKKSLLLFSILLLVTFAANAGVIIIEGKYQNKNLYVQNGYSSSGVGYCTYEVTVNGQVSTDEVNSSAFEIDFSQFQLQAGSEVVVEIKHKDDCSPKVLNPDALKPKATFEIVSININKEGLLKWRSKDENGSLPYIIEQFRWNKWIYVGEVQGLGAPGSHDYSFQTTVHSGENQFRLKQVGYGTKTKYSKPVTLISTIPQLTFTSSKSDNGVLFSGETMYEVYDLYGTIIKRGFGKAINIANLSKGNYYLCYDNTTAEFKKK